MPYRHNPTPNGFAWPDGKKLALSLVVNVEEGAEQRVDEGDNRPEPVDELGAVPSKPIRVYGNESNYQYGINRGAPRILSLLDQAEMNATWTVCGQALQKAPWLAKAIVERGDEPCNHGYKWRFTAFMDEATESEFIKKSTQSILDSCGRKPVGWLSRYLHSANTRRILKQHSYLYHMDDYSDDFPFWEGIEMEDGSIEKMVVVPYAIDSNDMKFWLSPSYTSDMWLQYAKDSLDWLSREAYQKGARMMSLGLHLRIIGRPGRITALEKFLDYVRSLENVWVATREQIAEHFVANVPTSFQ